ncbi:protein takeout-like [Cimex lectularius]|uniref:Takeout n=1 Tax=Cimex lectularius TaxID=79782 RepID=A0A8I6RIY3_CIMLE|nr:protein takeout-like [Cimex lectularius]
MSFRFYLLLLCLAVLAAAKIPNNWQTCKNAKDKNDCLRNALQIAIKDLSNGAPSLGVLPMDPWRLKHVTIGDGLKGPVSIKLELIESDLMGLRNIIVKDFKTDWETIYFDVDSPKVVVVGDYIVDGRVLILPVTGRGKCRMIFENFNTKCKMTLGKTNKGGKKYFTVKDLDLGLNATTFSARFDNLFNGDKLLGDTFNSFINQNWKVVFDELKPSVSKAYAAGFKEISNRIFSKIPADVLS